MERGERGYWNCSAIPPGDEYLYPYSNSHRMNIPESHPRYESLMTRERIVEGMVSGITAREGLIAHGRGEAFDYLIGEKTRDFGLAAEKAAVAYLMNAKNPVISINGNVAVLCPDELVELASLVGATVEINIFYRTDERMRRISEAMLEAGAVLPGKGDDNASEEGVSKGVELLGLEPDDRIPGLEHKRGLCTRRGIGSADVILVPLEDGDRAQALRGMGKTVLTVDLNPLSRTARTAHVTIVDHVNRAAGNMIGFAREFISGDTDPGFAREFISGDTDPGKITASYDNGKVVAEALRFMARRLERLADGEPEP